MTVYLPLRGPNERGMNPKACPLPGWNDPAYKGIQPWGLSNDGSDGWVGMRLDRHVVVDCDCACPKDANGQKPEVCQTPQVAAEAAEAWLKHIDQRYAHTWVRQTPHGFHYIYERPGLGSSGLTSCKLTAVHPRIDFKVGPGQQIVLLAPGYGDLSLPEQIAPFDPAWMPVTEKDRPVIEWSEMPDGSGDNAMISFAGKFREWGMDVPTIQKVLAAVNEITMTESPMPASSIRRIAKSAGRWQPDEAQVIECPKCGNGIEVR